MQLTIISDTAGIKPPRELNFSGGTLLDFLISEFGEDGPDIPINCYSGSLSEDCRIGDDYESLNSEYERVFIVYNPLGTETLLYLYIAAAVLAVVLIKSPELPAGTRQPKRSSNNDLTGQTNIARLLERVPDIFGQVKSYPDLIANTVFEYIDNVKHQDEFFCISRGYGEVLEFKTGDTLIDDIENSTVTVFEPHQPITDFIKSSQSSEIDGQVLLPANNVSFFQIYGSTGGSFDFYRIFAFYDSVNDRGTIQIAEIPENFDPLSDFEPGQNVSLSGRWWAYERPDFIDLSVIAGDYEIYDIQRVSSTVINLILKDAEVVAPTKWLAIEAFNDGYGDVLPQPIEGEENAIITTDPYFVGPAIVPGEDYTEVWCDIVFRRGLASGPRLNEQMSVDIEFFLEVVDANDNPTGLSFTEIKTFTGNKTTPYFFTSKITNITQGDRYRISASRVTLDDGDINSVDEVQWARLASIQPLDGADSVGTTRARVSTRADEQTVSIQDRRFNCQFIRKTVTWNGSQVVGDIQTGVGLSASRRFADALLHYILDPGLGARSISNVDVQGLYDIQDQLDLVDFGDRGTFSYTFDNPNLPAVEEMRIIADAARCILIKSGAYYSVVRDQPQSVSRALFNRRNKKPDSETRTFRMNKDLDYDGVQFSYNDIEDEKTRTISLPEDLPNTDPNFGLPPAKNPLKIEGVGIRFYRQAWDRAQYEFNKIIYSRETLNVGVTAEGALLSLNDKIDITDGTRLQSRRANLFSDGEIVSYSGLQVETSERVDFTFPPTSVILRNEFGEASAPIVVTPHPDTEYGFTLPGAPPFPLWIRGDSDRQRGTLYTAARDGNEDKRQYLVQRIKPDGDFYFEIECINYDERYFQADNQTPPPKV